MALTAVDIFAGAGGLTVGLKRAGFRVVAAVEREAHSFATYKANHPEVKCLKQDIATVSGAALQRFAGTERIDLLAGCPPCQGFTSLTAKYKQEDPRNTLILEVARLAEATGPQAILLENVPGMTQKGGPLYDQLRSRLQALGYRLTEGVLQVADYGVPQLRRRFVLLGGRGFEIALPDATHSGAPTGDLAPWRTVRDAIEDMPAPASLAAAKAKGPRRAYRLARGPESVAQEHRPNQVRESRGILDSHSGTSPARLPSQRLCRIHQRIRKDGMGPSVADDHRGLHDV